MIKAIEITAKQRESEPTLRVTLVLTTNREPDERLPRRVHAATSQARIDLDVWTRARLAHYLDNDPQAQWIRYKYFEGEPERLSLSLLQQLSHQSIDAFSLPDRPTLWVERALDSSLAAHKRRGVAFLVAGSGLGKSTACYKPLRRHVDAGGVGLVIPHAAIAVSLTLDGAIETTLRELHPNLAPVAGSDALSFCTPDAPLLLIVEDINRSGQPARLAERIAGWDRRTNERSQTVTRPVRLICPIWPEMLDALEEHSRREILERAIFAGPFSAEEGQTAVLWRARDAGIPLSEMDASDISELLGHDPLLIGLYNPTKKATSHTIIEDFVEACIARTAANRADHPAAQYRMALQKYAGAALRRRVLEPLWADLECWPELSGSERALLGYLAVRGDLIRLVGTSRRQRIGYRHDRVLGWLLIDAAASLLERDLLPDEILADPYYDCGGCLSSTVAHRADSATGATE